jgi:hypothetical protein
MAANVHFQLHTAYNMYPDLRSLEHSRSESQNYSAYWNCPRTPTRNYRVVLTRHNKPFNYSMDNLLWHIIRVFPWLTKKGQYFSKTDKPIVFGNETCLCSVIYALNFFHLAEPAQNTSLCFTLKHWPSTVSTWTSQDTLLLQATRNQGAAVTVSRLFLNPVHLVRNHSYWKPLHLH